jgi:hypothetical protein
VMSGAGGALVTGAAHRTCGERSLPGPDEGLRGIAVRRAACTPARKTALIESRSGPCRPPAFSRAGRSARVTGPPRPGPHRAAIDSGRERSEWDLEQGLAAC